MKKMITVGVAALAVALPVASATAGSKPDHPASAKDAAAKQCKTEKKADKAAFKATYGKHAMRTCIKGETPEAVTELKNAAKECKAARSDDADAFAAAWGDGKNAYGKCVSGTVRAENKSDVKEFKNAAKECKAARSDDADAFATAWGDGKNAYGECVSATAKGADEES